MVSLDVKDKKILYHLDLNSRESFRSIGRKVGLSKDMVSARVKRLQEEGVILLFYTRFDNSRQGLIALRLYIKFQYATPDKKEEIIRHFMDCPFVPNLVSTEGSYDLVVIFTFKNFHDINPHWLLTLERYGYYFSKRVISIFTGETDYPKSVLIDEVDDRVDLKTTLGVDAPVAIDAVDQKIIDLITFDARMPIIDIASKLKLTSNVVTYRMKKLKDSGVILQYKLLIDISKFGFRWYKADFFLKDYRIAPKIISYLEDKPFLAVVDRTIGYADLELELFLRNSDELLQVYEDISQKFPDAIKDFSYFRVVRAHKFFGSVKGDG
jgi:DNA-binding Lrp family transcriptional regulator